MFYYIHFRVDIYMYIHTCVADRNTSTYILKSDRDLDNVL